jgi:uncharacterized membrane protein
MVTLMSLLRAIVLGVVLAIPMMFAAAPALAQQAVQISTPYPAVAVEAGESVTFEIQVTADSPQSVALDIAAQPDGWNTTLRGGGFVIDGVFAESDEPPSVQLEVEVPADAEEGTHEVVVVASGGGVESRLPLRLRIAEAVAGSVELQTEFPSLRGASDTTFTFDLELANNSPEEIAFQLEAAGPEGWTVEARPATEQQAATATVAGGQTAGVQVEVDPPDDTTAGTYPIQVRAAGGGQQATAELEVEITGNFAMTLTTPNEQLNADVTSGRSTQLPVVVRNDGTAPLVGVELSADPPAEWEVTFEPEIVEQIPPGEQAQVTATITPSGEAVAGDYMVSLSANAEQTNSTADLRVTVQTSRLWGVVGIGLIGAAAAGLAWVFRRYGRR